ncbi:MAG: penicillin acylase family protein [Austwickia sp.]|nr:penicillin acylase family protein [Austwickia sp.]
MTSTRPARSRRRLALATLVSLAASVGSATSYAVPSRGPEAPAKVTITRNAYGIPHVYAQTTYDLFRGYGYAVAQDRLFQMEMSRRSTQGTVAEVLGPQYLAFDKDTRAGADPASIKAQLAALSKEDRDVFDGYAAGMNEWLATIATDTTHLMPKQFLDYGFAPSTWTGYDVAMVWIGTMANRYSDSTAEVANLKVLQQLTAAYGPDRGRTLFDQLVWPEDPLAPTTVPATGAVGTPIGTGRGQLRPITPGLDDAADRAMARSGGGAWPQSAPTASNIWITGKDKSADAKSVLINGPQFQWFNPSYVYGIGLHGAGYDFAGNTPFAYPAVIFGTNAQISWGATAGPMNVVDMYQERLDPANPRRYVHNGAYRDMTVRTETIHVRGAADVSYDVLGTVHGPVTSVDTAQGVAYSKKRSWAGAEVSSLLAWVKLSKARDFNEFRDLAGKFAISINWYYADKQGNIGYISPGRLPIRPANQDVRLPALGDGTMEWTGLNSPTANPLSYNPAQGYLANWNNQAAPGFNNDYGNWSVVDRVDQITTALASRRQFTAQQLWDLNQQFSYADLNLRYLAPTLATSVAGLPATDPARRDVELVTSWSGQTRDTDGDGFYEGPQPAIMRAWLPLLFQAVLADDLPPEVFAAYAGAGYARPVEQTSVRPAPGTKLVYNALLGARAGVPQKVDFFNGAAPASVLLSTYQQALAQLREQRGADMSGWTVPVARINYSAKNFLGIPQAGADETIVGPQYANRGTENNMAVLGQGQARLCLAAPPGQSGFIAPDGTRSPHYADQLELYASFSCRSEELTMAQVRAAAVSTTSLF